MKENSKTLSKQTVCILLGKQLMASLFIIFQSKEQSQFFYADQL